MMLAKNYSDACEVVKFMHKILLVSFFSGHTVYYYLNDV